MAPLPAHPQLERLFEAAAEAMGIGEGRQRLELVFQDGHLKQWWAHCEARPARELGRFDQQAALLLERLR